MSDETERAKEIGEAVKAADAKRRADAGIFIVLAAYFRGSIICRIKLQGALSLPQ